MFTHSRTRIALVAILAAIVALLVLAPSALAQNPTGEVEIVGAITSIEGTPSLAVSGLRVVYSAGAPVVTVNGLRVALSEAELSVPVQVGAAVRVEGMLQPDGTIRAREVKAAEDKGLLPGESEFTGLLAGFSSTSAVINGLLFDLTSAEVEPGLATGMVVKVHARLSDGGVWLAREIERFVPAVSGTPQGHVPIPAGAECTQCHQTQPVAAPGVVVEMDDGEIEIIGTLDEIGENYVVVAGQRYDTTGAKMEGPLIVGTLVEIELIRLPSGILIVREVEPASFVDDDDDLHDDDDDLHDDLDDHDDDLDDDTCEFEIEVASASLRSGPGTGYEVIGYAFDDDEFLVLAVDASGTWIKVATVGGEAWIAVSVGELDDDCHGLAITGDPFKDDDDDDGDDDDDDDGDDDHDDGDHDDGDHDDGDDDHDDDDDDDDDGDGDDDHDDDDD